MMSPCEYPVNLFLKKNRGYPRYAVTHSPDSFGMPVHKLRHGIPRLPENLTRLAPFPISRGRKPVD